jgi:peptide/nickel transport system substrate-binding protein
MKTLLKWTAGAVIALSAITGASAANTLKWGAARDLDSRDPYSYGSTFNLAFLNHVYEALTRAGRVLGIAVAHRAALSPAPRRDVP